MTKVQVSLVDLLNEIKEDVKEIKEKQIEQAIEQERQKWRHGFLGLVGGMISGLGTRMLPGIFHD